MRPMQDRSVSLIPVGRGSEGRSRGGVRWKMKEEGRSGKGSGKRGDEDSKTS